MTTEKLLRPKRTEKSVGGDNWQDLYFLKPGEYLIIETNINETKNSCKFKHLTVFTREDYLSDKKRQFPNADIDAFRKVYQFGGSEIVEWEGYVPDWIELPCDCISESKNKEDIKREEYRQPQEVEDKLSLLSKEDEYKRPNAVQYLIKKKKAV